MNSVHQSSASAESSSAQQSAVQGAGHGSAHLWVNCGTMFRSTHYHCARCGIDFFHDYQRIPGIFQNMALAGVPAECAPKD